MQGWELTSRTPGPPAIEIADHAVSLIIARRAAVRHSRCAVQGDRKRRAELEIPQAWHAALEADQTPTSMTNGVKCGIGG
jgi:hypothetical protein